MTRSRTDGETTAMNRQLDVEDRRRRPDTYTEMDLQVKAAQTALLARHAPDTRVRRVAWSQGETQVLELGAGSPLLLVHGGGDSAFEWVPIFPALARNHRVIAVDRPGHGLADPFDYRGVDLLDHASTFLRDVLDALELPAVDIVANSIGGLWSVVFALVAPDRVSRLALVGAPPGVARDAPLQLRLFGLPLVGRRLGRLLLSNPTRDSSRKFWGQILVAHPERLDDTLLDADVAHMRRNRDSIVSLMQSIVGAGGLRRRLLLGKRWQAVKVPTMFLWGERDAFMTPKMREAWEAIAARNPNISITRVSDAGHLPWIDAPERVVDEIEHFLAP
jgi:pimeloyl-ACP methyl ester carboxylesterase